MARKEQQLLQVKINKTSGKVEGDGELKTLQADGWQIAQIQAFDFNNSFSAALLLLEREEKRSKSVYPSGTAPTHS